MAEPLDSAGCALSSVFFASAGNASPGQKGTGKKGTGLLSVAGEFRVEGTVEEARKELIGILKSYWLDLLPPPLNAPLIVDVDVDELTIPGDDDIRQPLLVIGEVSAAEAATLAALIVPMPVLNQWKIKNKFTFRSLTAEELAPAFEYLRNNVPGDDPNTSVGYLNPWLVGGKSNRIDPESAVMPVRECAVMWIHAGAQWNDPNIESQALAFVDGLWRALEFNPDSKTALYGCTDIQLGSQLTNPPDFSYLQAYWSSPQYDFVDLLIGVKNKYDPCDLFKFAQSIPLTLDRPEE